MTDTTPARMIALIQQLYDVERGAAELTPEARQALRRELSAPVLAHIDAERARLAPIVLPKSPVGDAVRYLTNQWAALQRFVADGELAVDNNRANAASGICRRMPPARLCRVARLWNWIERISARAIVADAA
jgi:hypothetical protein